MDGRQSSQVKLLLEHLTSAHKKRGDQYAEEGDYIGAAGQYSHALNYFLFNNNPEITLHQLYLYRSSAYLKTSRYSHARCDLYTIMSNMPTAAVLQECYVILRALYFSENNVSTIAEEKFARDFKTLKPELYQSLVKPGTQQEIVAPQLPGFFKRLYRSIAGEKPQIKPITQAGTELLEPASFTAHALSEPMHHL
jgi:hypothetical protein